MDHSKFEAEIGIHFKDEKLLTQAFTHRSYINENRDSGPDNERLEFLGDAVLELVVTDFLYRKFPEMHEGELTAFRSALVEAKTCARVAEGLKVNEMMLLSKGESKEANSRARQIILANALEAIIGAIYLDQGYEAAQEFIYKHITSLTDEIKESGSWIDAKSLFQAKAQESESFTPIYRTLSESGPDHDKHFLVGVFIRDEKWGQGEGKSKQEAEQGAAREALKAKGWNQ